jgi:hypothetical protein
MDIGTPAQSIGVEVDTTTVVVCCERNPAIALGLAGGSLVVGCFGVGSFRDLITRFVDGWAGLALAALFWGMAGTFCTVGR